jgi:uncharacterized integral membrane protein
MPWKLISFLFVLVVITLFIGFNIENRCDVSFIMHTFRDVPIFVSLLFAYVAGAVTVIPFFFGYRKIRSQKPLKGHKPAPRQAGTNSRDYNIN